MKPNNKLKHPDWTIDNLPLSQASISILKAEGIDTIGALKQRLINEKPRDWKSSNVNAENEILEISAPYLERCPIYELPGQNNQKISVSVSQSSSSADSIEVLLRERTPYNSQGFSVRAWNVLSDIKKNGIKKISDLNYHVLMRQRNCGKKTAEEILRKIEDFVPKIPIQNPETELESKNFSALLERTLTDSEIAAVGTLEIRELNLPARAETYINVKSIEQLLKLNPRDILKKRNCGKKTIGQMKACIENSIKSVLQLEDEFRNQSLTIQGFIDNLLNELEPRAKNILMKRHGLWDGDEDTLESIGKEFRITRERVRQIQVKVEKFLRNSLVKRRVHLLMKCLGKKHVTEFLKANDGFAKIDELQGDIFSAKSDEKEALGHRFLLELFPEEKTSFFKDALVEGDLVFQDSESQVFFERLNSVIKRMLSSEGKPLALSAVRDALKEEFPETHLRAIKRCVEASSQFGFDETGYVGSKHWNFFSAKGIREMAQRALIDIGTASHYTHIVDRMNILFPSRAPFSVRVIHNCLGSHRDIFVLTGRGQYGLVNWGLSRRPYLKDFLVRAIQENGGVAEANFLVKEGQRRYGYKKTSILMTLGMNDHIFKAVNKNTYKVR